METDDWKDGRTKKHNPKFPTIKDGEEEEVEEQEEEPDRDVEEVETQLVLLEEETGGRCWWWEGVGVSVAILE